MVSYHSKSLQSGKTTGVCILKRITFLVYILGRKIKSGNYFDYDIVKVTASKKVKDQWIKKPGNYFTKKNLRVTIE